MRSEIGIATAAVILGAAAFTANTLKAPYLAEKPDEINPAAAAVAVGIGQLATSDVPDTPDVPAKDCPSCGGSGCVGDGTIAVKCQACDTPCAGMSLYEALAELQTLREYQRINEIFLTENGYRPAKDGAGRTEAATNTRRRLFRRK